MYPGGKNLHGPYKTTKHIADFSDQHSHKALGCSGHGQVATPCLDRMAREGARFTKAVVQNPICTPSRISLMSGQYCHNHGYYGLDGPMPMGLPSIKRHFRDNGYFTAHIGKTHYPKRWCIHDCDVVMQQDETHPGEAPGYYDYLEELGLEHLEDFKVALEELGSGVGHQDAQPSKLPYQHSREGWVAQQAIQVMKSCAANEQPFFVTACLMKPHQVYTPAVEFWDVYRTEDIELPPTVEHDLAGKSPLIEQVRNWYPVDTNDQKAVRDRHALLQRKLHGYLSCVSHVDHSVGELLDFLDVAGLRDNTIVVYSSDHGEHMGEFGLLEKAPGICSDAVCRVPYIWSWPTHIKPGQVIDTLVETVDIPVTLAALCDLPQLLTADGLDLSMVLRGDSQDVRDIAVCEFAWSKSVYYRNWHYVYYPRKMLPEFPDGFGELYDLDKDPWQISNLWFDKEYAHLRAEIQAHLMDWLVTTTRPATFIAGNKQSGSQWIDDPEHAVNHDGKFPPSQLHNLVGREYL